MVELIFTIIFWLIILGAFVFFKVLQDSERRKKRNDQRTRSEQTESMEYSQREEDRRAEQAGRNRTTPVQRARRKEQSPDRRNFLDRVREEYGEASENLQGAASTSYSQELQRRETERTSSSTDDRKQTETREKNPYLLEESLSSQELFSQKKLQEAIILKEILDKPLALRKKR